MTLKELLRVVSSIEKLKVVDFDTMETIYDNLNSSEIISLSVASGVDLSDFTVKTVGSLLNWQMNTTFIVIMVREVIVEYGE